MSGLGPSLVRSREVRFACPNRRACSQAILDSTPEKFANIRQMKGDGVSAINLEAARIHLVLSDDFVAVIVA